MDQKFKMRIIQYADLVGDIADIGIQKADSLLDAISVSKKIDESDFSNTKNASENKRSLTSLLQSNYNKLLLSATNSNIMTHFVISLARFVERMEKTNFANVVHTNNLVLNPTFIKIANSVGMGL